MKSYQNLTYCGKLRRLAKLARTALDAYGLGNARLELLRDTGNRLFRVVEPHPTPTPVTEGLFREGVYLLRLLQPGYQTPEAAVSELQWLSALRTEADLPIPEPMLTREGAWIAEVAVPFVPGSCNVSLVRWVKGRMIKHGVRPGHFRAAGRSMARLHDHAAHWQFAGRRGSAWSSTHQASFMPVQMATGFSGWLHSNTPNGSVIGPGRGKAN